MKFALDPLFDAFAKQLSDLVDSIGSACFYENIARCLGQLVSCPRLLVVRYGQYSRPEFIVNSSNPKESLDLYYKRLYRIDPIVKLVRTDTSKRILTFAELKRTAADSYFYEESFKLHNIYDELTLLFEAAGGIWFAVCVDRDESAFLDDEITAAKAVYPILDRLHQLHVESSMLTNCEGFLGNSSMAALAVSFAGSAISRSARWSRMIASTDALCDLAAKSSTGQHAITPFIVAHWQPLNPRHGFAQSGTIIVVEEKSPGYVDGTSNEWTERFGAMFSLTIRENQIVALTLKGNPSSVIADALGVSIGTVRNHKHRIYDKLDITSERELFVSFYTMLTDTP